MSKNKHKKQESIQNNTVSISTINNSGNSRLQIDTDLKYKKQVSLLRMQEDITNTTSSIQKARGDTSLQSGVAQNGFSVNNIIYPIYNRTALLNLYSMNEVHSACIDLLSNCVAGKGYTFLADNNDPKMKKVIDWAKKPNRLRFGYTLEGLLRDLAMDLAVYDTIETEIVVDASGMPNMYRANPAYMFIEPKKGGDGVPLAGKVNSYWQVINGKNRKYEPYMGKKRGAGHRIYETHVESPLSDYYGEPSYVIALRYIIENDNISIFNREFFENGAKLSYALLGTGYTLTDSDKTNLDTQIDNITGVGNRGKMFTMFIGNDKGDIGLTQMSQPFSSSFLDQKRLNDESIMLAHRVSARLLGKSGSGNIGGSSEDYSATKKYLETVVSMRKCMLEDYINIFIEEEFGINPKLNLNNIDIMTEKDKAITSTMLFNATDEFGNRGMDVETLREYNDQKQIKLLTERINEDVGESIGVSVGESGKVSGSNNMEIDIDAPNNLEARDR